MSVLRVRARAGARACAASARTQLNHSRCGSERARRRCGGSAETPPSCMPPMVTPLANVRLRGRRPLCVAAVAPPASRAFPVGVLGKRPPAHNRPPKLAPAPSNAHEQPYPPTPQKKIRARAKAATKTLAPRPRALPRGPTCMWPFQPRGLPSTRWTLARAHAAAAPALQKPLTKRRKRFRGLRARPLSARRCVFFTAPPQPLVTTPCAVQPYRAFPRLLLLHALKARSLRLGCRFARFRRTRAPFACERFAGSGSRARWACAWRGRKL